MSDRNDRNKKGFWASFGEGFGQRLGMMCASAVGASMIIGMLCASSQTHRTPSAPLPRLMASHPCVRLSRSLPFAGATVYFGKKFDLARVAANKLLLNHVTKSLVGIYALIFTGEYVVAPYLLIQWREFEQRYCCLLDLSLIPCQADRAPHSPADDTIWALKLQIHYSAGFWPCSLQGDAIETNM
jgi:hypothetical protein